LLLSRLQSSKKSVSYLEQWLREIGLLRRRKAIKSRSEENKIVWKLTKCICIAMI